MTAADKSPVREDLAGYRVTLAGLRRDCRFYHGCAEAWQIKATAATCTGDEATAEMAQAFAQVCHEESKELYEQHSLVLNIIRTLEKELTK